MAPIDARLDHPSPRAIVVSRGDTKEPATRMPTPWYQNSPCNKLSGFQNASFWIAVNLVRRHANGLTAGAEMGHALFPLLVSPAP